MGRISITRLPTTVNGTVEQSICQNCAAALTWNFKKVGCSPLGVTRALQRGRFANFRVSARASRRQTSQVANGSGRNGSRPSPRRIAPLRATATVEIRCLRRTARTPRTPRTVRCSRRPGCHRATGASGCPGASRTSSATVGVGNRLLLLLVLMSVHWWCR